MVERESDLKANISMRVGQGHVIPVQYFLLDCYTEGLWRRSRRGLNILEFANFPNALL